MSKTPVLITGCQRSGTTLMNLILGAHPSMLSIDEEKFDHPSINTYLHAHWLPDFVVFKLPRYAPVLSFITGINNLQTLWCLRDPVDVVWSMVKLQIPLNNTTRVSWAVHPSCAQGEILNSYWLLDQAIKSELAEDMNKFQVISRTPPNERSRHDAIFMGALCWRMKNELPFLYKSEKIDFYTVKYESLVTEPEKIMREILEYVGADWSDKVLRHHEASNGVSIGGTSNARPIDSSGVGGGVKSFNPEEVKLIQAVCGEIAEKWGYRIAT